MHLIGDGTRGARLEGKILGDLHYFLFSVFCLCIDNIFIFDCRLCLFRVVVQAKILSDSNGGNVSHNT